MVEGTRTRTATGTATRRETIVLPQESSRRAHRRHSRRFFSVEADVTRTGNVADIPVVARPRSVDDRTLGRTARIAPIARRAAVGASQAAVAEREKKLLATPAGLNCKFAGETKVYYEVVVAAAAAPRDRRKESGGGDDVNSQGK